MIKHNWHSGCTYFCCVNQARIISIMASSCTIGSSLVGCFCWGLQISGIFLAVDERRRGLERVGGRGHVRSYWEDPNNGFILFETMTAAVLLHV